MALDMLGLKEYATINPELRNLDSLYEILLDSEIIPKNVSRRCDIDFLLVSQNLQITFSARTSNDQEFCSKTSERVAEFIDNPRRITTYVPESFQFATAAVAGPYVPSSSAMGVAVHTFLLICALVMSVISIC